MNVCVKLKDASVSSAFAASVSSVGEGEDNEEDEEEVKVFLAYLSLRTSIRKAKLKGYAKTLVQQVSEVK